ncbi:MAG: hypothetical protein OXD54_16670 [Candidatus Poribacteria bacterium]|nr:hypothetical protein [Candidatus Poribacteria bacterium]
MQSALKNVEGVTEIVSVSQADGKAVVKVKKDKVKTAALVDAVAAAEIIDDQPRFTAQVIE